MLGDDRVDEVKVEAGVFAHRPRGQQRGRGLEFGNGRFLTVRSVVGRFGFGCCPAENIELLCALTPCVLDDLLLSMMSSTVSLAVQ